MNFLLRILFATFYTVIYTFTALIVAGGGHGTVIPLIPLFTWIFCLAAFIVLNTFGKLIFYILMAAHYCHFLLILYVLATHGLDPNDRDYWRDYPGMIVFTVILYLLGQGVMWGTFLRNTKQSHN